MTTLTLEVSGKAIGMAIAGGDNPRVDTVRAATARTTVQVVNGRIGAETIPAMIAAIAVVPTGGNVKITAENAAEIEVSIGDTTCLLYTSPSPRDQRGSRMPSSA